ncbi:type 1 fimbrial protein [Serratia fonticola]|uniref:fimbrial protein n=1 Tax=Serratia fonticola TaxID=47917 RepID=UPI00157687A6|nr:fimbrial protein [Serratia fonticola]NTY86575.1 type 1 fimbrial protein [Serratia fonticola]NTZ12460.1 type 1 fimbrial protein [Serratia fonticola]
MNIIIKMGMSLLLVSGSCGAVDMTLGGKVIATPCLVDTGSVSQEVDFRQLRATDLKTAGSSSEWQPFEVKLKSCPLSTSKVTVTLSGNVISGDATLFANAGTAANVAVQIAEDANRSNLLPNGGAGMTVNVDAQRNATYALVGRMNSPTGNTGPGTINSVVQMNFTYQ